MINRRSSVSDKYRWAVAEASYPNDEIIVSLESDMIANTSCRVRLTPENARDFANTLLAYAQDIETKNDK